MNARYSNPILATTNIMKFPSDTCRTHSFCTPMATEMIGVAHNSTAERTTSTDILTDYDSGQRGITKLKKLPPTKHVPHHTQQIVHVGFAVHTQSTRPKPTANKTSLGVLVTRECCHTQHSTMSIQKQKQFVEKKTSFTNNICLFVHNMERTLRTPELQIIS